MKLVQRKRDIVLLVLFVPVIAGGLLYNRYDFARMRAEMDKRAQAHLDAWFDYGEDSPDDFDVVTIVDVWKSYTLFGPAFGHVHTFFHTKGDMVFASMMGVEYFYSRKDGQWVLTDSAGCHSLEHNVEAFDELREMGVTVPDAAYGHFLEAD